MSLALKGLSGAWAFSRHLLRPVRSARIKLPLSRTYADLPKHTPVMLPALSPTMETGTILSWEKNEGDQVAEGDILAEIESDKATIGMETPEEGFLAKIVIPAGTKDVPIGKLVCVIVENAADVAAFKNYTGEG